MALPRNMKIWLVAGVVLLAAGVLIGWLWMAPRFDVERVRSAVVTTIQREAPASFYVTGQLDLAVTSSYERPIFVLPDLPFLPDAMRLKFASERATIQIPGRVSYGFDVRRLRKENIHITDAGIVEVTLPDLTVYAVEPDLERIEIQTENERLRLNDLPPIEERALARVRQEMQQQAEQYLQTSTQPRVYTAGALERLLRPVLQAAGMPDPQFRFRIGPRIVIEPEG